MNKIRNISLIVLILFMVLVGSSSCTIIDALGDGQVDIDEIGNIANESKEYIDLYNALKRTEFTEEDRYYVGRSTSAYVFSRYELLENEELTKYVNQIGQTAAMASTKATTFNGYRFNVIDDEHPNAYGTPGGMILISVGMLQLCENEDELAAVCAHEVEHIVRDHPMEAVSAETKKNAIDNFIKFKAKQILAEEAGEKVPEEFLGAAVDGFGNVLGDIRDVLDNGYEKGTEYEADEGAITTLQTAGYSVNALISIIKKLPHSEKSPYASNHPTPEERISAIETKIAELGIEPYTISEERTNRFKEMMKKAGIN
jgi:predicted Zn-dependent protease